MTGLERVENCFHGRVVGRLPVLPMVHAGLAAHAGVSLREFFADAGTMSRVMVEGYQRFGFDGVQLSQGVTAEVEALGAKVDQSPDAAPVLREYLLADPACLDKLRNRNAVTGGRLPLFFEAVESLCQRIGGEAFILATLRGPLVLGSQLRGVEDILIDMIERPAVVDEILSFATEIALQVADPTLTAGAHGLLLGEATCSPNFISPEFYRRFVQSHHQRLVADLKQMGWRYVGLHVCGNIVSIIDDLIATGVDFLDVDYQVPASKAVELAGDRVALRGNLDPISVLRFGLPDEVRDKTESLCRDVSGRRWLVSSGCDIPPGTPAENLTALVESVRAIK